MKSSPEDPAWLSPGSVLPSPAIVSSSMVPIPRSTGGISLFALTEASFQSPSGVTPHRSAASRVTIAVRTPPFPFPSQT